MFSTRPDQGWHLFAPIIIPPSQFDEVKSRIEADGVWQYRGNDDQYSTDASIVADFYCRWTLPPDPESDVEDGSQAILRATDDIYDKLPQAEFPDVGLLSEVFIIAE